jgi:beta-mannosidase
MFRFLFLVLVIFTETVSGQCIQQPLFASWRVRERADGKKRSLEWLDANVPGCVHTDLIRAEKLDHPFYGTNERDAQWVGERTWQYETLPFDVPDSIFNKAVVQWKFHGLDTYARIELNGAKLLDTDNAHRSWLVDVKPFLIKSGNILRITFYPAEKHAKELLAALPYPIPGDSIRAIVRKPQFHFGWDWGPRLVTCGITKPIEWVAYDVIRLEDGYFNTYSITEQLAKMKYEAKIYAQSDTKVLVKLMCNTNQSETDSTYSLRPGMNVIELPFEIRNPQVWWCNGQGHANLYSFEVKMLVQGKEQAHQTELVGLRDMRLITQPDSIGESFYFQLNGQPVFAKGANYIPIRYFPAEATEADYLKLIAQCKDAHINMLRVWGGGVYEDELFYDLCDQYGILVWHDFMFACSMYPGDEAFLQNVKAEAEEHVKRLRNHPCIALWCGNNENAEGWERWGWKSGLTPAEISSLQQAYDDVFKKILPDAVSQHSSTAYWESSPRLGRGDARSITEGDSHYWGVWHDAEPFEVLQVKVPRFMSEFGTQSYPSREVVEEMMEDDEVSIRDEGIAQHQKHGRGFDLMDMYLNNWYPAVSKDELALYGPMTQVVQAEGIAMGIEAQRRAMPRCMGTLYWQLNDVWPAFSWSGIDYKGTPKLLHHMLKTVYAPQLISCALDGDELGIWWISDARIDSDSMVLDYAIYDGASFVGQPHSQLRSTDRSYYQSPALPCRISYGSHRIHAILLEDLGIDTPENMIIEVRISYPGAANPTFKRIQKLIPKSDQAIVPYLTTYKLFDPKTRTSRDESVIMFKKAY